MPTQVKVLPITDRAHEYAKGLTAQLNDAEIRAAADCRSEKLGYKIREAQMQKIPYMLVIGDRDMENGTVSVRTRKGEDLGAMPPDEFIAKCLMEIATKSKEVYAASRRWRCEPAGGAVTQHQWVLSPIRFVFHTSRPIWDG